MTKTDLLTPTSHSANIKMATGLETYIDRLGIMRVEAKLTRDRVYDNLNEYIAKNTIFRSLTITFLHSTFTIMLTVYGLAGLLFVVRLVYCPLKKINAIIFLKIKFSLSKVYIRRSCLGS